MLHLQHHFLCNISCIVNAESTEEYIKYKQEWLLLSTSIQLTIRLYFYNVYIWEETVHPLPYC